MQGAVMKHGMTAVAGVLGLWFVFLTITAAANPGDDWDASTGERVAVGVIFSLAAILLFAGLAGMRRGKRGARIAVAIAAIVGGGLSFWAIAPPIVALAVVVWLYVTRRRRTPAPA